MRCVRPHSAVHTRHENTLSTKQISILPSLLLLCFFGSCGFCFCVIFAVDERLLTWYVNYNDVKMKNHYQHMKHSFAVARARSTTTTRTAVGKRKSLRMSIESGNNDYDNGAHSRPFSVSKNKKREESKNIKNKHAGDSRRWCAVTSLLGFHAMRLMTTHTTVTTTTVYWFLARTYAVATFVRCIS